MEKDVSARYEELDSARGLAALSVVFHHFLLIFPLFYVATYYNGEASAVNLIKYNPLHIFWAGHEAVIFFFMLSGFVLSLPFYSTRKFQYFPFVIKRIFRIYLPYLCAVTLAIILKFYFYQGPNPDLSSWFNTNWKAPTDLKLVLQHLLLIGDMNSDALDTATWSLVYEMRISLIFPLLMFFVIKFNWKAVLGVSIVLPFIINFVPYYIYPNFQYAGIFVVGALLAKHRLWLIEHYRALAGPFKIGLLVVGIYLYTFSWLFSNQSALHSDLRDGLMITGGASIFVVMCLASRSLKAVLHQRAVLFLGKMSYSLYLYHVIIMLSMVNALYGKLTIQLILVISFFVSLAVSAVLYYVIERPFMRYGRYLAEQFFPSGKTQAGTILTTIPASISMPILPVLLTESNNSNLYELAEPGPQSEMTNINILGTLKPEQITEGRV